MPICSFRRPRGVRHGLWLAALWLAAAAPGWAATAQQSLSFSSGTQSIWGSGGSAAFGGTAYVLGNHSLGVSYSAGASTGTVRSSLGGALAATFQDAVAFDQRSAVQIGFGFSGSSGSLSTDLGASIAVHAHINQTLAGIPINWNPAIVDYDYHLDIDRSFTPALPQAITGSDAFSPASVGIGLPTFGVGLAGGAGVDLDVRQTARLDITGLGGRVSARHRDSGEVVHQALSLTSAGGQFLSFDLARAGLWDFSYSALSVANRFTTQFGLDIRPYIEYGYGVFCGNLGTDSDNILCTDERLSTTLVGINLFSSPMLTLAYGSLDTGTAFSIDVLAAPVPEPASVLMMLAGAGALLARRRSLQAS